jgi:hypothetical protein
MPDLTELRDSCARHDLADFAQEFLRRNYRYRQQFSAISLSQEAGDQTGRMRGLARMWGLDFRIFAR